MNFSVFGLFPVCVFLLYILYRPNSHDSRQTVTLSSSPPPPLFTWHGGTSGWRSTMCWRTWTNGITAKKKSFIEKNFFSHFCDTDYTSALWALHIPELALPLVHLQLVVHVLHLATVLGEAANSQ